MADMVKGSLIVLWSHSIEEHQVCLTKVGVIWIIWSFSKESTSDQIMMIFVQLVGFWCYLIRIWWVVRHRTKSHGVNTFLIGHIQCIQPSCNSLPGELASYSQPPSAYPQGPIWALYLAAYPAGQKAYGPMQGHFIQPVIHLMVSCKRTIWILWCRERAQARLLLGSFGPTQAYIYWSRMASIATCWLIENKIIRK